MVYVTIQLPDFLTQSTQYEQKFHGHRNLDLIHCPIPSTWNITWHMASTTYINSVCISVLYYCWHRMLFTRKVQHLTKKFDYPQVWRTSAFKSLRFPHSDPSCFRHISILQGFPGGSVVKNLPAKAGDTGLIPLSGKSP